MYRERDSNPRPTRYGGISPNNKQHTVAYWLGTMRALLKPTSGLIPDGHPVEMVGFEPTQPYASVLQTDITLQLYRISM
ncbi:hypothetical protein AWW67_05655 [Roseivirga seohaensis]|uniref:Uncharacterized protein n=1 Tax=Roseivirga seohaensis TaxID=1914963 RepID=A0A150XW95_9BACT|nr:hypothetical protein AWW67_05655 [Roseivirga seohaensis]